MQAGFTLRPVARLKIDEVYYLTRMRTAQASVFTNHLTRSRINYQFTRALSLRMIVDYNAVLENAALIDLQRQKRLTGDALFDLPDSSGNRALLRLYGPSGKSGSV